jgi:hypothetical protein
MTVPEILGQIRKHPGELLVRRWNWKSAAFSSALRAATFFSMNLPAGRRAALSAMIAEFLYRSVTAGFYGAITQAFGEAEPAWAGGLIVIILLPMVSHSVELGVHPLRGTPRIVSSLIASVGFTVVSTLFNLYAMRRGALIVGANAGSVSADLRRMPALIAGFVAAGPLALWRLVYGLPQP